jgi:hypothetical protein
MVAAAEALTSKTRTAPPPLIASPGAAAPSMLTFLPRVSGVRLVMVWPARSGAKPISPPTQTLPSALRSEPGPLSAAVVTVTSLLQVRRSWSSMTGLRMPPGTVKVTLLMRARSGAVPSLALKAENGTVTCCQPVKLSTKAAKNFFSTGFAW